MQSGGGRIPGRRPRRQIADPGGGFLIHPDLGHTPNLAAGLRGRQVEAGNAAHRLELATCLS
jgi:hypothetical protein